MSSPQLQPGSVHGFIVMLSVGVCAHACPLSRAVIDLNWASVFFFPAVSAEVISSRCSSCFYYNTLLKVVDYRVWPLKGQCACLTPVHLLFSLLSQTTTHQLSVIITAPPPFPSLPVPEFSLVVPFPLCLQPANPCPTYSLRCPIPASPSLRCRWPRSVRRVPSHPAGPGLVCAAQAALAQLSTLPPGIRNRSSAPPTAESDRLPSSQKKPGKKLPTVGGQLACPFRRRFSLWYVENVVLILFHAAIGN